ncbi:MAG: AI-2E family transporter [Chloroflexi bacterium]|nr:AI-2E family transporter [Chloroflexota bacterium]MBU1746538.1 AI-2E family transporter [Chloroflexota bacterium]
MGNTIMDNKLFRGLAVVLLLCGLAFLAERVLTLLAYLSEPILLFFLAWLIAFVLGPAADWLESLHTPHWTGRLARLGNRRFPRVVAVALVYLGLALLLVLTGVLVVPVVVAQAVELGRNLPSLAAQIPDFVENLQQELVQRNININLEQVYDVQTLVRQVEAYGAALVQNTVQLVAGVAYVVANAIVMLVISFYIMLEGRRLGNRLIEQAPPQYRDQIEHLRWSVGSSFGGFVRGQIILAILFGIGAGVICLLAGLDYAAVIGAIVATLALLPFIGPMLGFIPPVLIAAFQSEWWVVLLVLAGMFVLQTIVYNMLSPKVLGETLGGLSPILVLAAVLVGIRVSGLWGALFGVPVAGVVYAMIALGYREFSKTWQQGPPTDPAG